MSIIGAPSDLFDGIPRTREDVLKFRAEHTDEDIEREEKVYRGFVDSIRKDAENVRLVILE